MSVIFHILDALSRDQYMKVTRETEEEQEIELTWVDSDNSEDVRKTYGDKVECKMIIHLF